MNPSDRDAYIKLINQTYKLDKDYKPDDLVSAPFVRSGVQSPYLRLYAAKALEAMLSEAYANGCSTGLTVTSCYRSYDYQQFLYDYRVSVYAYLGEEEAKKKAATIVAIPGQSEHQSGLAVDIHTLSSADEVFENTFEFQWLKENAWKFGFILRYPKDKTHITGIIYEPWHYRYVGRYHAFKIYESGLTLEEYCEQTGLGLE
jgi:LAS superfamily LD-carboxypeptidase LdcB